MTVLLNDHINSDLWREFVSSNCQTTPFQTPEFLRLLNYAIPTSGHAVCVLNNGRIVASAVIFLQKEKKIKGYFSRRGIIFGGPLIDPEFPEALEVLLKGITDSLKNKVIFTEIRNLSDYRPYNKYFTDNNWQYNEYLNCVLEIDDRENVFRRMVASRRRQINLSLQFGASFDECHDLADLEEFYKLISRFYLKELMLPLPPKEFFGAILKLKFGKIFIVRHNGRIIGGSICPYIENRTIYTYYYYGLRNYHEKIYPTHLSVLAAIDFALQNNISKLDFMGAGRPGVDYGVREYKLQFGSELHEYGRFLKIENPLFYQLGKSGLRLSKYLGL